MNNTVLANTSNYEKTYRLRLWINETADYSPVEVNGVQTYPMQDKLFNFIVNVYTEAEIVQNYTIANIGDRYCFGKECFEVVKSDSNETILLAEYGLDFENGCYSEATGLQYDHNYPLPGFDYTDTLDTSIYDEELHWTSIDQIEITNPGISDLDDETDAPYPYLASALSKTNNYLSILKTSYNVPSTATMRLPSIEEFRYALSTNYFGIEEYPCWTGSIASYSSIEKNGTTYYFPNLWVVDSYGDEQQYSTYFGDNYYDTAEIRPVLIIPTSDLPASNKFVTPTSPYVYPAAQSIATTLGLDYDDMNFDYDIVYGFIIPTGKIVESEEYYTTLTDDLYVIDMYSKTLLPGTGNEEGYKLILNYLKSIADDGKVYTTGDEEFDTSLITDDTFYIYADGYVTINGIKYYYTVETSNYSYGIYNYFLRQNYKCNLILTLSEQKWTWY